MRNQLFKFATAALVSSSVVASVKDADSKTYDDREAGMSIIETQLRDYLFPFDAQWPMIKVGLNYHIAGRLVGEQVTQAETGMNDEFGDPIEGEFELAPLDISFDVKIWATKNKFSVKYYRDVERKILATHVLVELDYPSIIYQKFKDLEMKDFECEFEITEPSHIGLSEFINLLWTPTTPPAMWYMGEVCMDEDNQEMMSFISDDMSGVEYILFFDKETKKAKKAISGITNALKQELGELTEFVDEDGTDHSHLATSVTGTFDLHEVVHSWNGHPDFWVTGCQTVDGSYEYKFEETEEMINLTGDMGLFFL